MSSVEVQDVLIEIGLAQDGTGAMFAMGWPDLRLVPIAAMQRKADFYHNFSESLETKIRQAIDACYLNCAK